MAYYPLAGVLLALAAPAAARAWVAPEIASEIASVVERAQLDLDEALRRIEEGPSESRDEAFDWISRRSLSFRRDDRAKAVAALDRAGDREDLTLAERSAAVRVLGELGGAAFDSDIQIAVVGALSNKLRPGLYGTAYLALRRVFRNWRRGWLASDDEDNLLRTMLASIERPGSTAERTGAVLALEGYLQADGLPSPTLPYGWFRDLIDAVLRPTENSVSRYESYETRDARGVLLRIQFRLARGLRTGTYERRRLRESLRRSSESAPDPLLRSLARSYTQRLS